MNLRFPPARRWALGLLLACAATGLAQAADKVLIVVSGEGRDQGRTRPGFEMDEFAQAYLIFRDNGLAVEVASPRGGAVEADRYDPKLDFNARLLEDGRGLRLLGASLATAAVRAEDYAAVYVVGGKGAMFDLPGDPALPRLLAEVYERGGVVAAVCHGPAALVDVRLDDGSYLVAGRAVTGFSNEEEAVFGKRWAKQFRFQLEDALRGRGARWQEAPLMMPGRAVDGRLITGQNPYATAAVAEAIVAALGRTPVARTPWRDERSLALVERLLAGEREAAHKALADEPDAYHVQLIGLIGYYQMQAHPEPARTRAALAIMQLAAPYMPEPQLRLGMAEAHWRLGDEARARAMIGEVLVSHPDMADAKRLLERIDG
ncbi:type 1 glutamine amidotransferase domain-containing protein [Lysobacter sp. 1R34A]|uniref:type 1 glutamine amidotransferase domain-containing protein n=1 Tax=Lysobacter sp. 1R34A TaxID=3445786 RepID=UPI003EF04DC5